MNHRQWGGNPPHRHNFDSKRDTGRAKKTLAFISCLLLVVGTCLAGIIKYTYDDAGRLVKADYEKGISIAYSYDNAGNLLSRKIQLASAGLYFPFYQANAISFVGFAVSNFSDKVANLEFSAFGADGRLLTFPSNPALMPLPSQNQLARLANEVFGISSSTPQAGWVQLTSDNPEIASFFQFGGPSQLDGSLAFAELSKKFYFTRVFEGATAFRGQQATTYISIANPNDQPVALRLSLYGPQAGQVLVTPQTENIPAKGFLYRTVSEIFATNLSVSSAFLEVEVTSGEGAVGFELIELPNHNTVIGLNASSGNNANQSFSAHLANGELAPGFAVFTDLKLVNVGNEARSVKLTVVAEDGSNLAKSVTASLAPLQLLENDVGQLFGLGANTAPPARAGSLRVEADGPGIIGDVIFGDPITFSNAASMLLQTRKFTRAVFGQVANLLGFFTGLALYNPGTATAQVTIEVFSAGGVKTGERTLSLGAGERISQLLSELIPATSGQAGGYVIVRSTEPLIAQQLFGDMGLTLLSAVPPTVVQ
ncbi:MAG: hypothetical protein HY645_15210 [Acidobacteria bacterium]|nr:hypothetical protein [Acidobacteriota bacterium]